MYMYMCEQSTWEEFKKKFPRRAKMGHNESLVRTIGAAALCSSTFTRDSIGPYDGRSVGRSVG